MENIDDSGSLDRDSGIMERSMDEDEIKRNLADYDLKNYKGMNEKD